MIQVRCPQCAATLSIKQAPASGKLKCPKCAAIISTGSAPATARSPSPEPARSPQATRLTQAASSQGDIDFRGIPTQTTSAPSGNFPMHGQSRVYDGPITLDPIPVPKEENAESKGHGAAGATPGNATKRKPKQKKVVIGLLVGLISVLAVGGSAFWYLGGAGGSGSGSVDMAAVAAAAAPSGFQAKSLMNCVVLMPKGSWGNEKRKAIPSSIESAVVMSDATTAVFVLAVMDGGSQPIDNEQMRKKASRSLGGDVLGGQPVERNGYKGIKGVLDGSVFLPRTNVEVFHHDGRFAIIGYAYATEGDGTTVVGGSPEEAKEIEVFLNSFKIGPPPSGFFGN